jgi:hypothetical protein
MISRMYTSDPNWHKLNPGSNRIPPPETPKPKRKITGAAYLKHFRQLAKQNDVFRLEFEPYETAKGRWYKNRKTDSETDGKTVLRLRPVTTHGTYIRALYLLATLVKDLPYEQNNTVRGLTRRSRINTRLGAWEWVKANTLKWNASTEKRAKASLLRAIVAHKRRPKAPPIPDDHPIFKWVPKDVWIPAVWTALAKRRR